MSRRTVSDLVARYTLEPTLRDVFVEGAFDEQIVRQYFLKTSRERPLVTRIDTIEISDDVLAKHRLTRGEKNEIVALAEEIFAALGDIPGITCIIDADCDRILGTLSTNPLILATDFTSMDMYWLSDETVGRFFAVMGEPSWDIETLTSHLASTGKEIFLVRAANQSLKLRAAIIPIRKYCTRKQSTLSFDASRYRETLLRAAGAWDQLNPFLSEIERLSLIIDNDMRNYVCGHDLTELLFIAYRDQLGRIGIKENRGVETIVGMMMPIERLHTYNLFQRLTVRIH